MLNEKTLYLIYLLHKANTLCADTNLSMFRTEKRRNAVLERVRLRSYLEGAKSNIDNETLTNILLSLRKVVDSPFIPTESKREFPRSVLQFNRSFKHWLSGVKSSSEVLNAKK
ncbi:hypothetical protein [Bacteroides sp. 519]|uniref:hypothetical protein n=1 Tax=Bacteroides sp. 519 TaxID=2302937 RepID=UPI0013D03A05|nr:hypothetical protein [Bacteroides sp. 519]NDV56892.1 hypothetical protein [Bacteroides sp. 519]